ncbi:diphthine synthase [Candidatus Geothermarchaeota archaeon ex4572_27]|nr:MAG: diphthine synthase [Candidatus Geothermarchaeota archaeon ex4572_27]
MMMPRVYIIGLGLGGWRGLPLEGLEAIRRVSRVLVDTYTNPISDEDLREISRLSGKKVSKLRRGDVEEGDAVFRAAEEGDIAILCGGDPLIATTHQQLVRELRRRGHEVRVIHGASVVTAAIGRSGLHVYKFGPPRTLMRPDVAPPGEVLRVLAENISRGLHTLVLLEYDAASGYVMGGREALEILYDSQRRMGARLPERGRPTLVMARLGYPDEEVVALRWGELPRGEVPGPAVIIVAGSLHFTEREYLRDIFGLDV